MRKFRIRRVKNYTLIQLESVALHLWVYSRGGFRLTIGKSDHACKLIDNIEQTVDSVVDILKKIYIGPMTHYKVRISQLLISYHPEKIPSFKLTYSYLLSRMTSVHNRIVYHNQGFEVSHVIDLYQVECGAGSFIFTITQGSERVANLRLFNNFKGLVFLYSMRYIQQVCKVLEKFVDYMMY